MTKNAEQELTQLASQLIEADRSVVKTIVEGRMSDLTEKLAEFVRLKKEIRVCLAGASITQVEDDETKAVLVRVSGSIPLESDKLIELCESQSGETLELEELDNDEVDRLGSEWLYSWISHNEYVKSLYQIGSLIVSYRIPEKLETYVREVRECYALQQYNAVIALCRTILEATAKDLCERQGLFQRLESKNIVEINPKIFNQLIRAIAKGQLKRRAIRLYYHDACPVIHGDRVVNGDQALKVLRDTISVVQEMYSIAGVS